ncbi:type II toxin-antitoxin system PemK/MazF family toxin [Staphylococcus pseudintermedius]|uniref:type II toxin-antitoxin system PemK/MazF family toxin n=1 Tax=Staphylococcus pseudintermedius TaxID=283734 RepID=UPI0018F6CCBD|nr:type II toxin-antitoxin system PemK/MazF family toxin [Staphylococcus pseudintermedius]MBJ8247907.1 type II toxin-antitoxin system PemK/MazF family toxin [Staphylococcus pseudintermedius]MBJ8250184.1 type II toxin-antitoxin system PemK/MazF family toxin [Staphylococcus pseudintermedius]MBJ8252453.1 type II toxin-antitoxin system PemK/MazF family toxin [Staphylococcus pseudintermedius]MBJ8259399.1 type II toxin-antitoxin system PemK/MazF family toxin [Staphylococcus pseudintermedius]MBJ82634
MEREVKNKKLLKATNNFEDICNSKNFKFKYLDDWLYTKSKILKKETHSNKQKEYRFYPRGTIVYAKLGVNIGSEFSGNHFCIVLNKNDHKRSELITVVPLTSKKTKISIRLPENILGHAIEKMEKDSLSLSHDFAKIKKMHKTSVDTGIIEPELETELDLIEKNYVELRKIIDRYGRFKGKHTYAIPSQVITISKKRISIINKYDPTGHISFNSTTLKKIEEYMQVNLFV